MQPHSHHNPNFLDQIPDKALDKAQALQNIVNRLNPIADALDRQGYNHLADHLDSISDSLLADMDMLTNGFEANVRFGKGKY